MNEGSKCFMQKRKEVSTTTVLQRGTTLKFITENFPKFRQSDKRWGNAEENEKKKIK